MKLNNFFRVSWMVQLMVGIGLFAVSFFIESQILQAFLSVPILAWFLALTLEVGKAAAIIWHRYLSAQSAEDYRPITRAFSAIFRVGLVMLSLLCSVLYLADHLDRPLLETVRTKEIQSVQHQLEQELVRLDADKAERLKSLQIRQHQEIIQAKQRHDNRQLELERNLKNEMDNVVRGIFKGPRYAEFERLLEEEKAARKANLQSIAQRHFDETTALRDHLSSQWETARATAITQADQRREALKAKDFANDERVNDPRIVAALKISDSVFDWEVEPLQFVFVFSILLSTLMEIGIMLAFDTVTVAMLPALKAQHKEDVETEVLKYELAGEARRDEIKHESILDRVGKRANRTLKEAEAMVDRLKNRAA